MRHRISILALVAFVLASALSFSACNRGARRRTYPGAPVILISIDTLRADRLPAYGYEHVETPNIDALRSDGVLFSDAYSQVPLTFPSHASLLTGLLPADNGVRNNIGYRLEDPKRPSIPTTLKAAGYATGAAISSYVLRSSTGLGALFDDYDDAIVPKPGEPIGSLQRSGYTSEEIASDWIARHKGERFFYLLHVFEPHSPYEAPEPFASRYKNPYDAEVATADDIVGKFIASLKESGVYDDAIVILISDHGEGLYEHGEPEHGIFLYREAIHVPLIVKLPKRARAGESVSRPVALVDLFPTITGLTGIATPDKLAGRSLFDEQKEGESRTIFSETLYPRIHLGWSDLRSLVGSDHQYIEAPKPELYAFRDDPQERTNILETDRRVYSAMKKELATYKYEVTGPGTVDPEEAAKLAALGYLGSTAAAGEGPLPDPKEKIGQIVAMMEATRLEREGRVRDAITTLEKVLKENPRFSDAWNQLARNHELLGEYEAAAGAYRQAIAISPALANEFGLSLGSVLLRLDRFDEAAAHARLGEKVNPSGSHMLLARVHLAKKEYALAESEANAAIGAGYSRVPALVLVIQICAQQGKLDEAMKHVAEIDAEIAARKLGPIEGFDAARGDVLARMEREDEAVAAFRREISNFPRNRNAYGNLAVVYFLRGDMRSVHALMEQMVRANPGVTALRFAAHTLEQIGDGPGSAEYRRRAKVEEQRLRPS
ncbi:MAG: sulfatase-like hydrolase/transferase [Thermoanaerobaculia bacterium]